MQDGDHIIGQESLFLDYIQRLEAHKLGRRAVHVHLSNLQRENRREHHLKLAASSFDEVVNRTLGQLFQMSNSDLVFVFREEALRDVEAIVVKLRFLFSDDPLLANDMADTAGPFATWYDVQKEYAALSKLAQRLHKLAKQQRAYTIAQRTNQQFRQAPAAQDPLTPQLLDQIEKALAQADLANHVRRQSICVIVAEADPKPLLTEVFISIADLRETLLPKVNLASSPWLFQHLTETLDRRVLSMLIKNDDRSLSRDVSINLNVATVMSEQFLTYDDNVSQSARGTITVELQKTDIYADLGLFLFVRDFLRERSYRICVDGLNHLTFPFIDRKRLGVDLLKVFWSPEMASQGPAQEKFAEAVKAAGPAHVILCRCDDARAIEFGQEHGISLFQGRHVEILRDAQNARRIAPTRVR